MVTLGEPPKSIMAFSKDYIFKNSVFRTGSKKKFNKMHGWELILRTIQNPLVESILRVICISTASLRMRKQPDGVQETYCYFYEVLTKPILHFMRLWLSLNTFFKRELCIKMRRDSKTLAVPGEAWAPKMISDTLFLCFVFSAFSFFFSLKNKFGNLVNY